ncbi:PREDICTED: uncharacterized protein LOC104700234 isoform X2 [Camelina sativa]|uniref:Uncharacterized protein LOC104700234 isoform X2 n=1 Tax=Camelina sativa TaxID=90675 RepID=A0ABM1Q896_CAMSA|nr:PREDICTED: uncharacterized protein LOC104700234 isoform X2 [Camelina sativa]
MMDELKDVKKFLNPTEVLLVVDTMTGQEASALVTTFDVEIGITGATLTKLDGAALSLKEVIAKLEGVVVIQYCALRLLQFVNLQATVDESLYDVSFKLQKMENEEGQVTFLLLLIMLMCSSTLVISMLMGCTLVNSLHFLSAVLSVLRVMPTVESTGYGRRRRRLKPNNSKTNKLCFLVSKFLFEI